MAIKKPSEMSNEELLKSEKTISSVFYAGIILGILLLGVTIFLTFKKGFTPLMVIPIAMIPMFLANRNSILAIKKEIKERGLK